MVRFTEKEYQSLLGKKKQEEELQEQVADLLLNLKLQAIHIENYAQRECPNPKCKTIINVVIKGNVGVSDWLIIGSKGLFVIELKSPDGKLTDEQKRFLERLPSCVPKLVSSNFEEVYKFINKHK